MAEAPTLLRAARRVVAAIAAEVLPGEGIAVAALVAVHPLAEDIAVVATIAAEPLLAGDIPVAADIEAQALPVEDMAARHQAAVIVVATQEAAPAVEFPAEALLIRTAILPQDAMAVDSSRPGWKPASSHRQEAPCGASCSSREGGVFSHWQMLYGRRLSTKRQQGSSSHTLSRVRELE